MLLYSQCSYAQCHAIAHTKTFKMIDTETTLSCYSSDALVAGMRQQGKRDLEKSQRQILSRVLKNNSTVGKQVRSLWDNAVWPLIVLHVL